MRPLRRLLLGLLLVTVPAPVTAQIVRGNVKEELRLVPLRAAEVLLIDLEGRVVATTVSDPFGRFALAGPEDGAYRLQVHAAGYESLVTEPLRVESTEDLELSIELLPSATELPGLEVTVDALGYVRQELANRGVLLEDLGNRFMDTSDIDRRIGARDLGAVIEAQGISGVWFLRPENVSGSDASDQWLCITLIRARTFLGESRCAIVVLDGRKVDWNAVSQIPGHELRAIMLLQPIEATLIYGTAGGAGAVLLFTK